MPLSPFILYKILKSDLMVIIQHKFGKFTILSTRFNSDYFQRYGTVYRNSLKGSPKWFEQILCLDCKPNKINVINIGTSVKR